MYSFINILWETWHEQSFNIDSFWIKKDVSSSRAYSCHVKWLKLVNQCQCQCSSPVQAGEGLTLGPLVRWEVDWALPDHGHHPPPPGAGLHSGHHPCLGLRLCPGLLDRGVCQFCHLWDHLHLAGFCIWFDHIDRYTFFCCTLHRSWYPLKMDILIFVRLLSK